MKKQITILSLCLLGNVCLAMAMLPPPGFPPANSSMDPTDTNNLSTNLPPEPTSGMFVTAASSDVAPCALVTTAVNVDTNITFGSLTPMLTWPQQTAINSGEYIFALFPQTWATRTTNTPIYMVSVWNTFTNVSGGVTNTYTATNSTTVSLPADQAIYTAQITCTNLDDWTNCFPVETVESRFTSTNYTSTNAWYGPLAWEGPDYTWSVEFINYYDGTPGYVQLTIEGTPRTAWQQLNSTGGPYGPWSNSTNTPITLPVIEDQPVTIPGTNQLGDLPMFFRAKSAP